MLAGDHVTGRLRDNQLRSSSENIYYLPIIFLFSFPPSPKTLVDDPSTLCPRKKGKTHEHSQDLHLHLSLVTLCKTKIKVVYKNVSQGFNEIKRCENKKMYFYIV